GILIRIGDDRADPGGAAGVLGVDVTDAQVHASGDRLAVHHPELELDRLPAEGRLPVPTAGIALGCTIAADTPAAGQSQGCEDADGASGPGALEDAHGITSRWSPR